MNIDKSVDFFVIPFQRLFKVARAVDRADFSVGRVECNDFVMRREFRKIEPEFVLRNENFELEKRVKVYRVERVFVNKKSVSYLLCGKRYRVQEQFLYKTYADAERAMNEKE